MIKELTLPLGALEVVNPLEVVAGQIYVTGWYVDRTTGQYYYYDAVSGQWYYYAAGYIYPLAVPSWKLSPSPLLYLLVGDTLRFRLSFKYLGDAVTGKKFHAAIGEEVPVPPAPGTDFAEIKTVIKAINIPKCITPTIITDQYIDIPIPSAAGGETITAYVKWEGWIFQQLTEGVNSTPLYYNVAQVAAVAGDFSEFKITKFEKV